MTAPSILIVEDEIALAEVVRDYLFAEGMSVGMLGEGAGALEMALSLIHFCRCRRSTLCISRA